MKILLVEDHRSLSEMVVDHLVAAGHVVDLATDGEEALSAVETAPPDIIILDLGLPRLDGMQVLAAVRSGKAKEVPVIILTARDDVENRIRGLDAGADDYLTKPFDLGELEARLRSVFRRSGPRGSEIISFGDLTFDVARLDARTSEYQLELARREYALLEELIRSAPRIVVKDRLEDRLYALHETVTTNAIEAIVSRLRKKLSAGGAAAHIVTVRGVGYKMVLGPAHEVE